MYWYLSTSSKNDLKSCHIYRYFYEHFCDPFTVMLENYFIALKVIVKCNKLFYNFHLSFSVKCKTS